MSFTTVYDGVRVVMQGLYPTTKTEIPFAMDLPSNNEQFLREGWGQYAGASTLNEKSTDYSHSVNQDIVIVISKEHPHNESDNESIHTTTKAIMADIETVKSSLLDLNKLGDVMKGGEQISFSDTSPIGIVGDETGRYLYIEASFSFDVTQEININ